MKWKTKAAIQNLVDRLPSSLSYASYYWLQRRFGNLRRVNPVPKLEAAAKIAELAARQGRTLRGSTVLEVGTGRRLTLPFGLWLLGAEQIVTVDLNPYLKLDLVLEDIAIMARDRQSLEGCFDGLQIVPDRLERLLEMAVEAPTLENLLQECSIRYLSPADAAHLDLPPASIDLHVSFNVLEHIPPEDLCAILREGSRLLRSDGLAIHRVDYSDHFSHGDPSISSINFLQYDDAAWSRYADNRYMYMNRLRVDDVTDLFDAAGYEAFSTDATVDTRAEALLEDPSFLLAERFRSKPAQVLSITDSWITARSSVS